MDAYPEDYVVHNLPFILLSGLDAGSDGDQHSDYPLLYKGDATIDSDFPPLTGPTAEQLRQAFLEEDASRAPWERRNEKRASSSGAGYKIKSVGRVRGVAYIGFKPRLPLTLHALNTLFVGRDRYREGRQSSS